MNYTRAKHIANYRATMQANNIKAMADGTYPLLLSQSEFDALLSDPEFQSFSAFNEWHEHGARLEVLPTATCALMKCLMLGVSLLVVPSEMPLVSS